MTEGGRNRGGVAVRNKLSLFRMRSEQAQCELHSRSCFSVKGPGSSPAWLWRQLKSARRRFDRCSLAAARIDIRGGQHSQQGRTAASTARVSSAAHSCDSSGPFKPVMQRCVFLGFRFVHRTRPPRVETRPKQQVYAPPFPWAERNPNSARHGRPGTVYNLIRRNTGLSIPRIISR